MPSFMFLLMFTASITRFVTAQTSDDGVIAVCTVMTADWVFNDEGQSPCKVANTLIGQCLQGVPGPFITQLQPGKLYQAPSVPNRCSCSSITYSLVSACALCQGQTISSWAGANRSWTSNCAASVITNGRYPLNIPQNLSVPTWAYQNISQIFNPLQAIETAREDLADSTFIPSSSSFGLTTSVVSTPSLTSAPFHSETPPEGGESHKKSDARLIGGLVAGALGGTIVLLVIFSVYRSHHKKQGQIAHFQGMYRSMGYEENPPYFPSKSTIVAAQYNPYQLYDPADPSTYPPTACSILPMDLASPISSTTRHTRQHSDESISPSSQTRTTHTRQTSTDSTSSKSIMTPVSSARVRTSHRDTIPAVLYIVLFKSKE